MKEEDLRHVFKSTERTQMKGDMTLRSYGISKDVGRIFIEDNILETLFSQDSIRGGFKKRETRGKKEETIKSEREGGGSKVTSRFLLTRDIFSSSRHQIVFLDAVLRAFGVKGISLETCDSRV